MKKLLLTGLLLTWGIFAFAQPFRGGGTTPFRGGTDLPSLAVVGNATVGGTLAVTGETTLTGNTAITGTLTTTGTISDSDVPVITFVVGSEASDIILVTIQVEENDGTDISHICYVRCWLSDTAGAVPTSTAPDGGGTANIGWVTTPGTEWEEETAEIYYTILSDGTGTITVGVEDDDADNNWYMNAEIDGKVYSSAVIDHGV